MDAWTLQLIGVALRNYSLALQLGIQGNFVDLVFQSFFFFLLCLCRLKDNRRGPCETSDIVAAPSQTVFSLIFCLGSDQSADLTEARICIFSIYSFVTEAKEDQVRSTST